jgi:hypothetical protein
VKQADLTLAGDTIGDIVLVNSQPERMYTRDELLDERPEILMPTYFRRPGRMKKARW